MYDQTGLVNLITDNIAAAKSFSDAYNCRKYIRRAEDEMGLSSSNAIALHGELDRRIQKIIAHARYVEIRGLMDDEHYCERRRFSHTEAAI